MHHLNAARVGQLVTDNSGETIGTIEQVGTRYFVVTKGLIFKRDLYVPFSAVDAVATDGMSLRLNVDKDRIDEMGWAEEPLDDDPAYRTDVSYDSTVAVDHARLQRDGAVRSRDDSLAARGSSTR